MHPAVFQEFDRICRAQSVSGHVLEIGARPAPDTLLALPALAGARCLIGIDLDRPHQWNEIPILAGNANRLTMFTNGSFDAVLCNSVLEYDREFWRTLAEIDRVLRPGGILVAGVPGYGPMGGSSFRRVSGLLRFYPWLGRERESIRASSATLGLHNYPGDYYRFSEQAVAQVFFAGYEQVAVVSVLMPPRLIGWGRKRRARPAARPQ